MKGIIHYPNGGNKTVQVAGGAGDSVVTSFGTFILIGGELVHVADSKIRLNIVDEPWPITGSGVFTKDVSGGPDIWSNVKTWNP